MDTLDTFWDNITYYKTESVNFLVLMNSATRLLEAFLYLRCDLYTFTFAADFCIGGQRILMWSCFAVVMRGQQGSGVDSACFLDLFGAFVVP